MAIIRLGGLSRRLGGRATHAGVVGRSGRGGSPLTSLPAWLTGGVGVWSQISGTAFDARLHDYSGTALRNDGQVWVYTVLGGGHSSPGYMTDNSVMGLRLDVASPAQQQLRAASSSAGFNPAAPTAYFTSDGAPTPRHTYHDIDYCPQLTRVMVGGRFTGSNASDFPSWDGFNVSNNTYDADNTWPDRSGAGASVVARDPTTGIFYSVNDQTKWDPASPSTWQAWTLSGAASNRLPGAIDHTRGNLFHFSAGDGWTTGGGSILANRIVLSTGVSTALTLSGTGWSQLQTDAALTAFNCHAIVYSADDDAFFLYANLSGATQRVYKITPNNTTSWDVSILSVSGVTPANEANGIQRNLHYVSQWRTLLLAVASNDLYYLRLA